MIPTVLLTADVRSEEEFAAKMILQVHDELLFEAPAKEKEKLEKLVRAEMEGVYELTVPLMVACILAPPSSSGSTDCPIAALTSAGPARQSWLPSVISSLSHSTGKYAPPAMQLPITAAI